jgi:glyoxylase-like metal-dependent hydrolase (beta-lactamase superfamily II)
MKVLWIPGEGMFANAYVCGGVLVDAGVPPSALEPYLDQITSIVLTHGHFDHIAQVTEIARVSGARICIHRGDAHALQDDRFSLASHFGARPPGILPDMILNEGDSVAGFTVLHTPGHTPGSICLFDSDSGILISGDTVFTDGAFGRFDFPGGSARELRRSLERLEALEVTGLYPGHGEPRDTGGAGDIHAAASLIRELYG